MMSSVVVLQRLNTDGDAKSVPKRAAATSSVTIIVVIVLRVLLLDRNDVADEKSFSSDTHQ